MNAEQNKRGERLSQLAGSLFGTSRIFRRDESDTTSAFDHLRSRRFVRTDYGWFVKTREQTDLGPFKTYNDALAGLKRHIARQSGSSARHHSVPIHYGMAIHDPEQCTKRNCAVCMEAYTYLNTQSAKAVSKTGSE